MPLILAIETPIGTTGQLQQEALAQPAVVVSEGSLIAGMFKVVAEL